MLSGETTHLELRFARENHLWRVRKVNERHKSHLGRSQRKQRKGDIERKEGVHSKLRLRQGGPARCLSPRRGHQRRTSAPAPQGPLPGGRCHPLDPPSLRCTGCLTRRATAHGRAEHLPTVRPQLRHRLMPVLLRRVRCGHSSSSPHQDVRNVPQDGTPVRRVRSEPGFAALSIMYVPLRFWRLLRFSQYGPFHCISLPFPTVPQEAASMLLCYTEDAQAMGATP